MAGGMVQAAVHIIVVIVALAQIAAFGFLQVKKAHGPSTLVALTFLLTSGVYCLSACIPESEKELEHRKRLPPMARHFVY